MTEAERNLIDVSLRYYAIMGPASLMHYGTNELEIALAAMAVVRERRTAEIWKKP